MTSITWPPTYQIRQSAKAKRLFLQISPRKGLEVVLPVKRKYIDARLKSELEFLLNSKRRWIERHLSKLLLSNLAPNTLTHNANEAISLPTSLKLLAIDETILITYELKDTKRLTLKLTENTVAERDCERFARNDASPELITHLKITGPIHNHQAVFALLKKWVKAKAYQTLYPWLLKESLNIGLPFTGFSVRSQSTLWGSCTPSHKISLNQKLIFLPKALTRYVLIHELCHIKHLNHSKRFWALVEKYDPNWRLHRRALRKEAILGHIEHEVFLS